MWIIGATFSVLASATVDRLLWLEDSTDTLERRRNLHTFMCANVPPECPTSCCFDGLCDTSFCYMWIDCCPNSALPATTTTPDSTTTLPPTLTFSTTTTPTTTTTEIQPCPAGYTHTLKNVNGKGKKWSWPGESIDDCKRECDKRKSYYACTSFEYNAGTHKCGTYYGGESNVYGTQKTGWTTCLKKPPCPSGYAHTLKNVNGKGKKWSWPGESIQDCKRTCDKRSGCTSFEYNAGTHKCGTYTGGKSNVYGTQKAAWTTCLRT